MEFKYIYRALYAMIIAHMVHKIYCRATAKYQAPLLAVALGFLGLDVGKKKQSPDVELSDDDRVEVSDTWGLAKIAQHNSLAIKTGTRTLSLGHPKFNRKSSKQRVIK